MRITKVYTKTGDQGTTGLADGSRVSKNHVRIEAYGCVDELNATIGLVLTAARDARNVERLAQTLQEVQHGLFELGADLATPKPGPDGPRVGEIEVRALEEAIDSFNEDLDPLREFILPGGGPIGASLHFARCVCRRGERRLLDLLEAEPQTPTGGLIYLNRLSDLLFVLGRWATRMLGEPEVLWSPRST